MRQKITSITQHLRLPVVCALCHHYHRGLYAVCDGCQGLLVPLQAKCRICCLSLPDEQFPLCGACIKQPPYYDQVLTNYRFEEPLRTLVHDFKYHKALYLRTFLRQLMLDALPTPTHPLGCLVPVPMYHKRLRQRGFNPAGELAKLLAHQLNRPIDLTLCEKIIHTPTQVSLTGLERYRNLNHAFRAKPSPYHHITLVDDLITTGSTANELAKVLKKQGVRRVDVWCLARA